jgi:hypothetical protein
MRKTGNKNILFLVLSLILLFEGDLFAQRTLIDVKIDSAAILIGEQTLVHLTLTTDKERNVQIVVPGDTIMHGVEILAVSDPDSLLMENDRLLIKQDWLITSFDSSLYLLPPVKVIDGADTIYSNRLALKVSTFPVNTDAPDEFYDIKSVWKPPFVIADYYPLIFGVLVALFLICVAGYVIRRIRSNKPILPLKKDDPLLPPHIQATKELDWIKQQKLWQQGRIKEYYTLMTDTLRKYIVHRFDIHAMEMTSDEILTIIRRENEAESVHENLKQILQLADFVKFAKITPLPDENDLSMMYAYLFVNQTKQSDPITTTENNSTVTQEES